MIVSSRTTNKNSINKAASSPRPSQQQHQHGRSKKRPRRILIFQWMIGIFGFVSGMASFHGIQIPHEPRLSSLQSPSSPRGTTSSKAVSTAAIINTTTTSTTSQFAYAFLISGCDPLAPLTYRPYLWNILVATKNLRQPIGHINNDHPTDVVVMVQFQHNTTTSTLPLSDVQWLELYDNIKIHYVPPLLKSNFYTAQFAKFHILELTQYDRVLYLDADVMPLCSLDYIFMLSSTVTNRNRINNNNKHQIGQPLLQPNVVLAWFTEPAHGGWFLLQPFPGAYQQLQDIIQRREQEALTLPYPHWDPIKGWGAPLNDDEWLGIGGPPLTGEAEGNQSTLPDGTRRFGPPKHSSNWTFHGDFADQGLLYYWTRFHQKAVSILFLDSIVDYVGGTRTHRNGSDVVAELRHFSCLRPLQEQLGHYGSTLQAPLFYGKVPHRDFIHFSGSQKPWETKRTTFWSSTTSSTSTHEGLKSSTDFWYFQLEQVWKDFAKKNPNRKLPTLPLKFKAPPLGRYPTHRSMIRTIQKKLRKQRQQQQDE